MLCGLYAGKLSKLDYTFRHPRSQSAARLVLARALKILPGLAFCTSVTVEASTDRMTRLLRMLVTGRPKYRSPPAPVVTLTDQDLVQCHLS